jgi:hypothetical protein
MEVAAMAHLGNGWVSYWMRSGRYTYRQVVVHPTNPNHLIPSTGTPSDRPPLQLAITPRLRAELAAELGWYPADLDDESIARHRADAAHKKTDRDPPPKGGHT